METEKSESIIKNFFSRGPYKLNKENRKPQSFKCDFCGTTYSARSGLWKHIARKMKKNDASHRLSAEPAELVKLAQEIERSIKAILFILNTNH
jgi:hypothetical protein